MDTISLCRLACGDKKIKYGFGGVFAADTLPKYKQKFYKFIVNLDDSSLSGSHWVSIVFEDNIAYYYDSYGKPPKTPTILEFMNRNAKHILYNPICHQDDLTITCGYFSLYFLYTMSRNQSVSSLNFQNKSTNEKFIHEFAKSKLKLAKCCYVHHSIPQSCVALSNVVTKTSLHMF